MLFRKPEIKTKDINVQKTNNLLGFIAMIETLVTTVLEKYLAKNENMNTKARLIQRKVI